MGVYSESGALKITVSDTSAPLGRYAADSSIRVTIVTGSTYTGLYAPDGSMNVVAEEGSLYHPCGAVRGVVPNGAQGLYSPAGALYMEGLSFTVNNIIWDTGNNLIWGAGNNLTWGVS